MPQPMPQPPRKLPDAVKTTKPATTAKPAANAKPATTAAKPKSAVTQVQGITTPSVKDNRGNLVAALAVHRPLIRRRLRTGGVR